MGAYEDGDGERFFSICEYPEVGHNKNACSPAELPISPGPSDDPTIIDALVENEQEIAQFTSVLAKYGAPCIALWILAMATIFWLIESDAAGSNVTSA
jgi:hypothetical protein